MSSSNRRIGLILFAIYLVVYAGFVLLNAFAPDVMKVEPIAGVNLAVVYGFGLILSAFGLAVVYGLVSRRTGTSGPSNVDQRGMKT